MAANLTDVAIKARMFIKWGIIMAIVALILRITWFVGVMVYKKANPPKPPPPTVAFGRLEPIKFPEKSGSAEGLTYKLETPSGGFPTFPDRMNVYVMPGASTSLFSLDESVEKAKALGFDVKPVQLSETIYRFNNNVVPSSLEINILTGVFTSNYNLAFDPTPTLERPPDRELATNRLLSIFKGAQVLPTDINEEKAMHDFLSVEGQNLVSTISLSEAKLIKVNLFRDDVVLDAKNEEGISYPSKTANPKEANVWAILSGGNSIQKTIIASKFFYFPVDYEKFETYPIINAQMAWDELQKGNAFIANRGLKAAGEVVVRNIYLAYFDPASVSQYYQPIVVFEGDNDFVAYVPAVTFEYYGGVEEEGAPAGEAGS